MVVEPGETVTAGEVRKGGERKEERLQGIGVKGRELQAMGREEGGDGDEEGVGDGGERWAVENDVETIPEGGGGGAKGAQPLRVTPVATRRGGEMEVSGK